MIPTLIDATLSDPRVSIGAIVLAALSTGGFIVREWIRLRKHARNNAAQVEVAEAEVDAARVQAEPGVLAEVRGIVRDVRADLAQVKAEAKADREACTKERREAEARHRAEREADHERCQQQIAAVRADIATVAATQIARGHDDTGLHRIVRRSPTPPEPMHAIPPPPRGKETDR